MSPTLQTTMTDIARQALRRQAAHEAKGDYLQELFEAGMDGDCLDREAGEWLYRLMELVGPFIGMDATVDRWYEAEEARPLKLVE
jgi:hypothetical protein